MSIKLQLPDLTDLKPRITVIGVGGAGGNAVNNMIAPDSTASSSSSPTPMRRRCRAPAPSTASSSASTLTEGLGAGSQARDRRGRRRGGASRRSAGDHRRLPHGVHRRRHGRRHRHGRRAGDRARRARSRASSTVGVVTKPFHFEGARRMRIAEAGIAELQKYVDTLIVIPNQNLFRVANEKTTFAEAFVLADQVLYSGVACIIDLIVKEGLINLDFADVRTVMSGMGKAMMGTGEAEGEQPRHRRRRGRDRQSAARRRVDEGRQRPAAHHHRRPRPDAVTRSTRRPTASARRSIPTPTSSSARPSTRARRPIRVSVVATGHGRSACRRAAGAAHRAAHSALAGASDAGCRPAAPRGADARNAGAGDRASRRPASDPRAARPKRRAMPQRLARARQRVDRGLVSAMSRRPHSRAAAPGRAERSGAVHAGAAGDAAPPGRAHADDRGLPAGGAARASRPEPATLRAVLPAQRRSRLPQRSDLASARRRGENSGDEREHGVRAAAGRS